MPSEPLDQLAAADRDRVEALLVGFDAGWEPGRLAAVVDSLPTGGPFRAAALRELVKIELERQARRGSPVPLAEYLGRYPDLLDDGRAPADLLGAEAAGLTTVVRSPGPATAPELPERFGRYRIVRPLGRGAMGTVYLAHDEDLDRTVALKVPHFPPGDAVAAERFAREARAAATIDHPNVCRLYDVGRIDGVPYLTMAYVEGGSLADELQAGPLPVDRAIEVARDVALALAEAHRRGVTHRDLKPANVLIGPDGRPVVTDFGLARREAENRLTGEGEVIGTPLYMAPEQVAGDPTRVGPACDVYALGAVLYELLTGAPPFTGSRTEVFRQALTAPPRPPSAARPGLEPGLDRLVARALAKQPADRFPDMPAVAAALAGWLSARRPSARRRWLRWFG